ncbi:N-formylglutamate amidohydrolase [Brucellaceae bacterium C25G]
MTPAFDVLAPAEQRIPFVFNSPHSGAHYPDSFLEASALDALTIRSSEDCYVDELYASAVLLGAPLLRARFPRAYLDVNREAYELDQRMFFETVPSFANTHSARVAGGLGTVPRLVGEGRLIYPGKIPLQSALDRIEKLYKPYHMQLRELLDQTRNKFGYAVLIDCHSMPNSDEPSGGKRADFIIGDRFGRSCHIGLAAATIDLLQNYGFDVAYNKPYAGGFITEHYGRPDQNIHALQLEMNRSLYMNEKSLEKLVSFDLLRRDLYDFLSDLTSLPDSVLGYSQLAAE